METVRTLQGKSFLALLLLAVLLAAVLKPGAVVTKPSWLLVAAICLITAVAFCRVLRGIRPRATLDIHLIILAFLLLWDVLSKHLNRVNPILMPPPENVFYVFYSHGGMMLQGVFASMQLLTVGFAVSLFFGVSLGLMIGWVERLREVFYPIVKVLTPIPSVIYTPYIVACMPTFRSASAMLIILGLFFPTLLQMIGRVRQMDRRILYSARAMVVSHRTMILRVLLPYMIPGVIAGLRVSLSTSIMILTLAEMMGATSGMGYFIKNYADFANYTNVIAGIILVGLVITALNGLVTLLETRVVKWE